MRQGIVSVVGMALLRRLVVARCGTGVHRCGSGRRWLGVLVMAFLGFSALMGGAVPGFAQSPTNSDSIIFTRETAEIVRGDGARYPLQVEMAVSPEQRARGLMFRTELATGEGMLFDFGRSFQVRMWMKNTLIPLDMLFMDHSGRVVYIVHDAQPEDLTPVGPEQAVSAVLELPGGQAALWGLAVGDRVAHPMFASR